MARRIRDIGQNVLQYYFQTRSSISPSYCHIFYLSHSSRRPFFLKKIIFVLRINYIIITCSNDNNAVINNNYGSSHLILLFKIPTGIRKYLFEIYRQIGHAPLEMCSSPAVSHTCSYIVSQRSETVGARTVLKAEWTAGTRCNGFRITL